MPTYDYLCSDCSHRFEEFQSITAEPIRTCPKCSGKVRRLISSGNGLIFKGSGFYITDYKNSKSKEAAKDSPEKKAAANGKKEKPRKAASNSD